jgi:hypothetical protein
MFPTWSATQYQVECQQQERAAPHEQHDPERILLALDIHFLCWITRVVKANPSRQLVHLVPFYFGHDGFLPVNQLDSQATGGNPTPPPKFLSPNDITLDDSVRLGLPDVQTFGELPRPDGDGKYEDNSNLPFV